MWYLFKSVIKGKNLAYFFGVIFFVLVQTICDIILPLMLTNLNNVLSEYTNSLLNKNSAINHALIIGGIIFGISIIELVFGVLGQAYGSKLGVKLASQLRYNTYSKIQKLSFSDFDNFKTSRLITCLTSDIQAIQNAFIFLFRIGFRSIFLYLFGIVGIIIIVFTQQIISNTAWLTPTIMIVISVTLFVLLSVISFYSSKYHKLAKYATDDVNSSIQENILGARVVKSFNLQDSQIKRFDVINNRMRRISQKSFLISMWTFPIINFVLSAAIIIVIFTGTTTKSITIENTTTLISICSLILMGMVLLINVIMLISISLGSASRIKSIIIFESSIKYDCNGENITNSSIELKNVNFKYHDTSEYVLKNINLKIDENETIGIIGGTGSGKSTLVSLIARMYDVQDGEILISGHDIKKINENSLRKEIGISPQQVILFSGTIASNLKYGKPDATIDDMIEAAKGAQAYEFINQKENGFDSIVEQRGANFSGGQKQRLSIARVLIKKPKILILDSSTSALDMETEKKVNNYIKQTNNNRTTIIISQRISGVKDADRIIVLNNGEIVGNDTHLNLLKTCKDYYDIAISQLGEEGVKNEINK